MAKGYAKYYSRLVAGYATLLVGIIALIGGIVIGSQASGTPSLTGGSISLSVVTNSSNNDNEAVGEAPEELDGDTFDGVKFVAPVGYAEYYIHESVVRIWHDGDPTRPGDGPGTGQPIGPMDLTLQRVSGEADAFMLAQFCFGTDASQHDHITFADHNNIDGNGTAVWSKTFTWANAGSPIMIPTLPYKGAACFFAVKPRMGLSAGTHLTRLVFTSRNGGYPPAPVDLLFEVTEPSISLTPTAHTFPTANVGYAFPFENPLRNATITNTGNVETGQLRVSVLDDKNSSQFSQNFSLSETDDYEKFIYINSLPNRYDTAQFTVRPVRGLPAGTYKATVMVESNMLGFPLTARSFIVSFTVTGSASISLSHFPDDFQARPFGYTNPPVITAYIDSNGNIPTGSLTANLQGANAGNFRINTNLSTLSINSIAVGGQEQFTIQPITGLPVGVYNVTVVVSGANVTSQSFMLSFTVNIVPSYGIDLTPTHIDFGQMPANYSSPPAARSAMIQNIGNQPTGRLFIDLSGTNNNSFELSETSVLDISVGGSKQFTIRPKTDLPAGTHTATVTISGGNIESKTLTVTFLVVTLGISLEPSPTRLPASMYLPNSMQFYPTSFRLANNPPDALPALVTNIGNQPTGTLTVKLKGPDADIFVLSTPSLASLEPNAEVSFTVRPKALPTTVQSEKHYWAYVEVSGANVETQNFQIRYIVFKCCDCGLDSPANTGPNTAWLLALLSMVGIAVLLVLCFTTKPKSAPLALAPFHQGIARQTKLNQYGTQIGSQSKAQIEPSRPQAAESGQRPPINSASPSTPVQAPPRPSAVPSTAQAPSRPTITSSSAQAVGSKSSTMQSAPVRSAVQTPPTSVQQSPRSSQPTKPSQPAGQPQSAKQ